MLLLSEDDGVDIGVPLRYFFNKQLFIIPKNATGEQVRDIFGYFLKNLALNMDGYCCCPEAGVFGTSSEPSSVRWYIGTRLLQIPSIGGPAASPAMNPVE